MRPETPILSPSVAGALEGFAQGDRVHAWALAEALLRRHPEYASGRGREQRVREAQLRRDRQPPAEWLEQVKALYDAEKVPELHGRLFIIGLGLLDRGLGRELAASGFLDALVAELREPIELLLSPKGQELWAQLKQPVASETAARRSSDIYPTAIPHHLDAPVDIDLLGRKVFADALEMRLRDIWYEHSKAGYVSASLIHIHGAWGSGKTSLLNFLRHLLREERRVATSEGERLLPAWIIVDFNAWQHQRLNPPWWPLMNAVYRDSLHQIRDRRRVLRLRLREWMWRISTGRVHYFLAVGLFFWLLALLVWGISPGLGSSPPVQTAADFAKSLSTVIALLATVWGLVLGITRSLLPASASAARTFMESSHDPLARVSRHFKDLVGWIGQPVTVFIDDLDRCQATYAVELLEGIQTLFKEAGVTYVIAADRRWLRHSYETAYKTFVGAVDEPGRPLGYLFLAKTFELFVSVPVLPPEYQDQFWRHLLRVEQPVSQEDLYKARSTAQERLKDLGSEEEILAELHRDPGIGIEQLALREAAIQRLAQPQLQAKTEHALLPFARLLEPNPRAMKRLANAYGISRDILILTSPVFDMNVLKKLALWTTVTVRWPILADVLAEAPNLIDHIRGRTLPQEANGVQESLRQLLQDPGVHNVVMGNGVDASLDESDIQTFVGLRIHVSPGPPHAPR